MDITILYGSQTGNAEDMAKRIGNIAKSLGFRVLVETADDFQLRLLPKQNILIFVCSTTGHGQEPENMKNFYNFIRRRDLPEGCLSGLKYVVYGLGDSSYAKFNYVSKIVYKRLRECGAEPLQDLVIGDEQHQLGCDGIIYPKLEEFWETLKNNCDYSTMPISDLVGEESPQNSYEVVFSHEDAPIPDGVFSSDFTTRYNIQTAICTSNKRVTCQSHFQDTRLISFETEDDISYEPGDVCCILPANDDCNVDEFIQLLGLDPDRRINITKKDPNYMVNYLYDFVPQGLTTRDLVKYYLDIQSVPRRSFFQFLWPFSQNEMERNKLKEFSETEGYEDMYDYCILPKRSILEVLADFPRTVSNIELKFLFDLIPPIKPRSFSIASSLAIEPKRFQLLVGVVSYKTRLMKTRLGLCSNYLAKIKVPEGSEISLENKLNFYIKNSSFKLPKDSQVPIMMVGPGLGLAPFWSFIEEISMWKNPPESYLYFGCRFKSKDFYFKEELTSLANSGLINLKVAFSREEPKHYVQDLVMKDSNLIRELITEKRGVVYVAGNSKLPDELRELIGKIICKGQVDMDPSKIVTSLENQNRILYDCW